MDTNDEFQKLLEKIENEFANFKILHAARSNVRALCVIKLVRLVARAKELATNNRESIKISNLLRFDNVLEGMTNEIEDINASRASTIH